MTETRMADSFWSGRSVLVTGGTSFTAFWLIPELIRRGARVAALVRPGTARSAWPLRALPPDVAIVEGAVTDAGLLGGVLNACRVETVFHLAAQSLAPEALQDPAGTLDVNVRGTWTVLDAARATGGCQVLIASSAKVYGDGHASPIREEAALLGTQPYDVSKACAEQLAVMYAATYRVPTGSLRCGNLFGGGDLNWSRSIPGMIRAALRGERFVVRSDGRAMRDYLYVEDAVNGFLRLAEALAEDRSLSGQAFNLGLGRGTSVLELSDLVLRIVGRSDLPPVILGAASGEVAVQYLNPEKAQRLLNWTPSHGIGDGLQKAVSWYRKHLQQLHAEDAAWSLTPDRIGV